MKTNMTDLSDLKHKIKPIKPLKSINIHGYILHMDPINMKNPILDKIGTVLAKKLIKG